MGRRRPACSSSESSCDTSTASGSGSDMASPDSSTSTNFNSSDTNTIINYKELRRERTRIAVRNRRTAESSLFQELGKSLPVSPTVLKSLDKLAVLRVAQSYFKLRAVLECLQPTKDEVLDTEAVNSALLLRDDSFLVIMSTTGDIIYVSDNVTKSLRCEQHGVLGTNIYDHIHGPDHAEIDHLLSVQDLQPITPGGRHGSTLKTPRTSATVRIRADASSGCKAQRSIQITGKVFLSGTNGQSESFFVGIGEPLVNPSDFEFPFPQFSILKYWDWMCNPDMRTLVTCSPDPFLGYDATDHELLGNSPFDMFHADDTQLVTEGMRKVFSHGSHQFGAFRLLAKGGGWAWFVTQASTTVVQKRGKDGKMEAVTYCSGRDFMVSEVLHREEILSTIQIVRPPQPSIQDGSHSESLLQFEECHTLPLEEDELMGLVEEMIADDGWFDELFAASMNGPGPPESSESESDTPHSQINLKFPTITELLKQTQ